jgi:hypothetical protein
MMIVLSILAMNCGAAMADEAKIPNNFQSGTPAFAEEVNENFSAVKDAVDDNFSRINKKQNRITGTCPSGQSIRVVNDDGTVDCEADSDSGGDITAVNPGTFMSGGGQSGAVTLDVSGMPGVDYVESSKSHYMTTTDAEILSQTITVPTTGYVMAFFGGMAAINHSGNADRYIRCWISTTGNQNDRGKSLRIYNIPASTPDELYTYNVSTFCVFPVNHGSTKIYAMGDSNSSSSSKNTYFYRCSLNLLFFPARY